MYNELQPEPNPYVNKCATCKYFTVFISRTDAGLCSWGAQGSVTLPNGRHGVSVVDGCHLHETKEPAK